MAFSPEAYLDADLAQEGRRPAQSPGEGARPVGPLTCPIFSDHF
jgi:hypothetical protein